MAIASCQHEGPTNTRMTSTRARTRNSPSCKRCWWRKCRLCAGAEIRSGAGRWRDLRQSGARHHAADSLSALQARGARAPAAATTAAAAAPSAASAGQRQVARTPHQRAPARMSSRSASWRCASAASCAAIRSAGRARGAAGPAGCRRAEFSRQPKLAPQLAQTRAACRGARCAQCPGSPVAALISANPHALFARIASCCIRRRRCMLGCIRRAVVEAGAQIDPSAEVGRACRGRRAASHRPALLDRARPACIGRGVHSVPDCRLVARVTLERGVRLGRARTHPSGRGHRRRRLRLRARGRALAQGAADRHGARRR